MFTFKVQLSNKQIRQLIAHHFCAKFDTDEVKSHHVKVNRNGVTVSTERVEKFGFVWTKAEKGTETCQRV